uniref:Resistance protein RGA2 n=2 Tax=Triticum TaxID=4564 RepID=B4YSW6_TRITD|nr:resistance protein RGA2 [Triticum turgidum subsp. durum]ADM65817.1 leaf rust resistance protein Lr10 [Triticum dicoccoides]ADM65819.1 leaf rust resistance protein Lr10 [Triticum dicoccoides]ADM65820.1 leaf rust resistance protein Lr10 [Triticum dicoccoides]ADM65821.1 leaf rust resistance protein Lr10 [Triticum dicoccoides]
MAPYLVSASTGAVGSLLAKLGTMLVDGYILLNVVRRDIEFVIRELAIWQSFLLKVADSEEPGPHDKSCADFARELSYDIEDKIDNWMSLMLHHVYSNSGCKKHMIKFNNLSVKNRHQIAKDIRDIKSQILEAHDRYMVDYVYPARTEFVDPRLCTVDTCAADLVGIDGPKHELVKWLRNGEDESVHQQKVVSIVGCAGLGKTTLAKQVYDELRINFEYRAFVSISRSPDMATILKCVLSQFHAQDYSSDESEIPKLVDQIRDLLQDKRYFVIIDDIWDMKTWDVLKCALCKNSCGSVIMTTTRIYDVAKSCCSSDGDLVYNIRPLSVADSEKLFLNRVFGHEKEFPPELKEVSKDVLKKCGGLPLAINAISRLLAAEENKEEWGHVGLSNVFAQGEKSDIDAMKYILSLSYFDLPPHLRSCLLYLAMFPEDCLIEKERLVHRWISEGFICNEDGEDLVEVGERYLYELVNRSLIESVGVPYDRKARFYRVHNVILDFLMIKSMEENFCTLTSNQSRLDYKVRRLSLFANKDPSCIAQLDLSHARSLGASGHLGQLISSVKSNALRVLDVQDCLELGNHHVKDIGRNPLLRYLNISGTDVTELPIQIGDMEFLETLDASFTELVEMPGSITRLRQLQRLFVSDETKLPDEIGNMKRLQELGDINAFKQSVNFLNELGKLTGLRKLGIIWDTNDILKSGKGSSKEKRLVSSLSKLDAGRLSNLYVTFYLREKDGFIGHPFLPALNSIREVYLRRGRMCWMNKWLLSLANLEKLYISGGDEIEQDDLRTVGSIPTLVEFKLYSGCLGPIIISSGFEQLERLELKFSFSQLTFEVGAMPNLKKLDLHVYLSKFKSVGAGFDFGIQHLSSLACVSIVIFCEGVSAAYVEAAEGAFKSMVNAHPNPNRPMLEMTRESADFMSQDE